MHKIIEGPADWRGPDIAHRATGSTTSRPTRSPRSRPRLRSAKARGKTMATLTQNDFPLPTVAKRIEVARDHLENRARALPVPRHQDRRLHEGRPAAPLLGPRAAHRHRGVAEQGRRRPGRRAQRRRRHQQRRRGAATSRTSASTSTPTPPTWSGLFVLLRGQERRHEHGGELGRGPQRDRAAAARPARGAVRAVLLELEQAGAAGRAALLPPADLQPCTTASSRAATSAARSSTPRRSTRCRA